MSKPKPSGSGLAIRARTAGRGSSASQSRIFDWASVGSDSSLEIFGIGKYFFVLFVSFLCFPEDLSVFFVCDWFVFIVSAIVFCVSGVCLAMERP